MTDTETHALSHFVGGRDLPGDARFERRNPSDIADVVATAPCGSAAEVDAAVAAARSALPGWSAASPEMRADLLDAIGQRLMERREAIGHSLAREEGKTLGEAIGETMRAARIFRYFAGEALRAHGRTLASVRGGIDLRTHGEPIGVAALVTPWNFPIAIPAWKAAPALAFGNCVVLKPSEMAPLTASILAGLFAECGAPAGVFNLVHGDGSTGAALAGHEAIDAVSFTGSVRTGSAIAARAGARRCRVQLEMGGKNPLVVLDDADLDRAVTLALDGGFYQTGQRCTASSRIVVTEGIHDRFVNALSERVAALRVGHALAPTTQVGPAVSEAQRETSYRYIEAAKAEGGRVVAGGARIESSTDGWYIAPTLIAGTEQAMTINREEVFGPVAAVVRVRDYEEALGVANAGEFGLSAGIVTESLAKARDFEHRVRAGMVMINLPTAGVDYHVPFGGMRGSSFGPREQGFAAAQFYTQTKTVYAG